MSNVEKPDFVDDDLLEDMLNFLDDLRESGSVNMFGAPSVLRDMYHDNLSKNQSREVTKYWMLTFEERHKNDAVDDAVSS